MSIGSSLVLLALVFYHASVSWRVLADEALSRKQKLAQLSIVWIVPLAGALLVHWISLAQARRRERPSCTYANYEDYQDHQVSPRMQDDT